MNDAQYADLQREKELLNCGLTQDSIQAIRSTSVVTHNGSQHVVPESQAGQFDYNGSSTSTSENSTSTTQSYSQFEEHQRMVTRFKHYTEKRITDLERQVQQSQQTIVKLQQTIETLQSNQQAQLRQLRQELQSAQQPQQQQPQQESSQQQQQPAKTEQKGTIDPDFSVENIFYSGQR